MKLASLIIVISILFFGFTSCVSAPERETQIRANPFVIPAGAELLESTEFKSEGIPYLIERRYRLPSGEILWAYFDVEGSNSVTIQRIEERPILALGTDVNISGLPGYREFFFGDDRLKLVQFMKIMRLGQRDLMGNVAAPSLSDGIFSISGSFRSEFTLLLDLFDETWVLEHSRYFTSGGRESFFSKDTTRIVRVNQFDDQSPFADLLRR